MDKEHNIDQLNSDLEKIMGMFRKVEFSSIKDVDSLKEELNLLQEELKERYGKQNSPETDTPEA